DQPRSNSVNLDTNLLYTAILLISIGLMMVYSASIAYASKDSGVGNSYFYLIRHILSLGLGSIAGIGVFSIPTDLWKRNSNLVIIGVIILLMLVLIPHIGHVVNGSRRWLPLVVFNLQPSELAKLGTAIYVANYCCSHSLSLKKFRTDILPILTTLGIIWALLLAEPDMGSTTVVFIIALTILFLADLDIRAIWSILSFGAIAFIVLVILAPYRLKRVTGFLDPWQDALGKGYQLSQSLLAFGHGSWFGVGLGNSIEKLYYLPEAHTDFIMAVIGEEFGSVGIMIILGLFGLIFYRGFNIIAREAKYLPDRQFQSLLAYGISTWFFAQAMVNIGVALGILPTKGLTLPFISFGGSSILVNCMALALLLRIDYENKLLWKEKSKS
ncbi:MAG: putative lipid flippase FtsW, partial [Pseudomonadota bacterium]